MPIISEVCRRIDMSHMVDLKNPDWVIIIEIVKKTCCLTVTNEYQRFKKFNIREMTDFSQKDKSGKEEEEEEKKKETGKEEKEQVTDTKEEKE